MAYSELSKNDKAPYISIVVPFFRAEDTMAACIQSVLSQTFSNWELILVDDGSDDSGAEIAARFVGVDSRVKLLRQENRGRSAARNAGILFAKGEWVSFLDADDELATASLELLAEHVMDADCVWGSVVSSSCGIPSSKSVVAAGVFSSIDLLRHIVSAKYSLSDAGERFFFEGLIERSACGKLYRREVLEKRHLLFCEGVEMGEDALFNIEYLSAVRKVSAFDCPVYYYNQSNEGTCRQFSSSDASRLMVFAYASEAKLMPLVENGSLTREDLLSFISTDVFGVLDRAVRYSSDYDSAARDLEHVVRDPLIRVSLRHCWRLTFKSSCFRFLQQILLRCGKIKNALIVGSVVSGVGKMRRLGSAKGHNGKML